MRPTGKKKYLSEHMKDVPVHDLLQEMEGYTGNKSEVFGGNHVYYCSLISGIRVRAAEKPWQRRCSAIMHRTENCR